MHTYPEIFMVSIFHDFHGWYLATTTQLLRCTLALYPGGREQNLLKSAKNPGKRGICEIE